MLIRTAVGILLALLVIAMLFFGMPLMLPVFTVCSVLAVHELGSAIGRKDFRPFMAPAFVFAALYPAAVFFLAPIGVLLLWMVCVLAVIIDRILNRIRKTEEAFLALIPFVYPLPFFAILLLLANSFGRQEGITALLLAFGCPLLGDTFAYFAGTLWGKHKLYVELSPKKTVEGSIASVFGSVAAGAIIYFLQPLWGTALPVLPLLLIGLVCGFLGQIGDLFASAVKRWAGIKDFGTIFPGHGGVMDRVDSVLLCAPVVYLCFYLL